MLQTNSLSLTHSYTHVYPLGDKDGYKVTTVLATIGSPPDRQQDISYMDLKIIGNGSFGVEIWQFSWWQQQTRPIILSPAYARGVITNSHWQVIDSK